MRKDKEILREGQKQRGRGGEREDGEGERGRERGTGGERGGDNRDKGRDVGRETK